MLLIRQQWNKVSKKQREFILINGKKKGPGYIKNCLSKSGFEYRYLNIVETGIGSEQQIDNNYIPTDLMEIVDYTHWQQQQM